MKELRIDKNEFAHLNKLEDLSKKIHFGFISKFIEWLFQDLLLILQRHHDATTFTISIMGFVNGTKIKINETIFKERQLRDRKMTKSYCLSR